MGGLAVAILASAIFGWWLVAERRSLSTFVTMVLVGAGVSLSLWLLAMFIIAVSMSNYSPIF